MKFAVLDWASLPGDPAGPNEDAFAAEGAGAVVMDGATGLGEPLLDGGSDAAWVAAFGAARLMAERRAGKTCEEALREALGATQREFERLRRRAPNETWEIPFASMMFASLADGALEALWFGDCAALVGSPGGGAAIVGDALSRRAKERERVARLAASFGAAAAERGVREVFLPALREARNGVNTRTGSWLFGPDARAAAHVARTTLPAPEGSIVLLATDGFLALTSDYGAYGPDSLLDAALSKGLASLGRELRAIEATDPDGRRFPRFKRSDDATALLLRVCA